MVQRYGVVVTLLFFAFFTKATNITFPSKSYEIPPDIAETRILAIKLYV